MSLHIAIPEPTSSDTEYNQRSLPPYLAALHSAGVTPVVVPLHERPDRVARLLRGVQGILLPGSRFDVDPQRFGEDPIPECGEADPGRAAVDELLLQDAFNLQKPILAICQGIQALNVWCGGTLIQDIPTQIGTAVNHSPGRTVLEAHPIEITPNTRLAAIERHCHSEHSEGSASSGLSVQQFVNSSHHQAVRDPGDNLIVSACSPQDNVIEAVELASGDHFVVAVQWHPERSYDQSPLSRAIFATFVHATESWTPRRIEESVLAG